ncbi:transporter substrate-binding domain-containing protein [Burkholderia gladioli]|uniref:transporter substrate-binding domain-containing protein n=1 Tax=Burkholderia gladioli TaxID=28095 RepID=UPI00164032D5|nr:transporter substrate-binding domain-containing protein [Burkholderia gladioli]
MIPALIPARSRARAVASCLGFGIACAGATAFAASPAAPGAEPIANAAGAAPAAASRLDEVLARGVLRVCTTGDYRPYSYYRPDGRFEGIDIDLAESLARSLKVRTEYVKTSWRALTDDFVARCDIAVGGISTTLDRQQRAFFTRPTMQDGKTPIVRCADVGRYQSVAQIDQPATRVIVNPGGTNERFARQYLGHAQLSVHPDNVTIFREILDGRADVMVTDASETLWQQKLNPGLCSVHPEQPFQFGEKAYMVPRGDVVFQQYVDQWLHLARETGEFQAVTDKWLK